MNKPSREIVLSDDQAALLLRRRSRRGFLVAGLAGAAGIAGYEAVMRAGKEDSLPWTERRVLEVNRKLSQAYLSDAHLMPTYPPSRVEPLKPNGDIGLDPDFELSKWRLAVTSDSAAPGLDLTLADITALPRIEMITRFCCIEGWTRITQWAGTRFSDFTKKFFPPGQGLPKYVYMTTPDEEYYVGAGHEERSSSSNAAGLRVKWKAARSRAWCAASAGDPG